MSAAKRGKHAKRPTRANRASGLAVAVGLGIAVAATGHGVASASTGEDSTSGTPDADAGSKATTATESDTTTPSASEPEKSAPTTTTSTTSGTQPTTTTTTTSGNGPTSTVSASGGSGTTVSTIEPTTDKPKPAETASETTTSTPEKTVETGIQTGKEKSSTSSTAQSSTSVTSAATVAQEKLEVNQSAAAETLNATAESKTQETSSAPAARTMTATTSTTTPLAGLPTVTLPPYPTIPGVSPTRVAVAVVIVLGRALQTALSGPVPNPIAIPIYMVLVAAYQRLTEIALNHVPVVTQPTPALQVPIVGTITGTVVATDPDGDPLTFSYTQPTNGGLVVVTKVPLTNQYTYVYTPPLLGGGGPNSFTITFDDTGVGDHFYAPNGHTTSYTVNLDVPTPVVGARDSIGVVRGGFAGSAAGRTFSLANGNTAGATAASAFTSLGGIVNLNTSTGDWTYVPAVSGHNILGIPTNTDTFVVTVDDGVAGAVQTTVSVGADLGTAVTGASTNVSNGAYSGGLNIPVGDSGLLTYSAGSTPTKGSLFVNGNGGFIYTPTPEARHAAAATNATAADKTDIFTIKGTDASGRSITVATVSVDILSLNNAPTGGAATFPSADANGVISGSVTGVTDADNDTLTYSGTAGKGTVVFTGTSYTYTPTLTARHNAAADGASTATKQDTITITVDDGHGGTKTFSSGAFNITPQNNAPQGLVTGPASSGTLGLTKSWTITGPTGTGSPVDADSDSITYAVTTFPTGVNVPVILGNSVTLLTVLGGHGSFVVTMSDGHGGNVPLTLTY